MGKENINIELSWVKNISMTGWKPCTETNYPIDGDNDIIVIAYYREYDNEWQYFTYEECPYGWNVLCDSIAYWRQLPHPILIKK